MTENICIGHHILPCSHDQNHIQHALTKTYAQHPPQNVNSGYFAEGIAESPDGQEIYMLTWRAGVVVVYDKKTFQPKRKEKIKGEGTIET